MNKRGQFFLVAALAIIGILIGLAAHYSSAEKSPSDTVVYDLSKEINYESGQVIDHGLFYSLSQEQKNRNIENITDHYARANPGTDLIFIYGDKSEIQVTTYQTSSSGSIGMDVGSSSLSLGQSMTGKNTTSVPLTAGDETVFLNLQGESGNITYSFNLKPGQTFFVLLKKEKQGERYIATSELGSETDIPEQNINCGDGLCSPGESFSDCPADCSSSLSCTDDDGDGYNLTAAGCGPSDCNDSDSNINPGETEACDGAVDNDCDGTRDVFEAGCPACIDSDGGQNYLVSGTVYDQANPSGAGEACMDSTTLLEKYCSGNIIAWELHTCPSGCQVISGGGACN